MKNKTLDLRKVKLTFHDNGFPKGFILKRKLTLRECRYVMRELLGIEISTREDFEFKDDYADYNNDLRLDVNDWLEGNCDESRIAQYAYDCSDEQLGMHNMLVVTSYLKKKNII